MIQSAGQTAPVATQLDLLDGRRKRRAPKVRTPEHLEQVALMQWASLPTSLKRYPELELLHAVPNGGHRFISVAKAMKAEGVKAGVPDLDLPVPRGPFIGLRIELKAKGGKESPPQKWWRERLTAHGHRALVCVGWEEAKRAIETYLALPRMPAGWQTPGEKPSDLAEQSLGMVAATVKQSLSVQEEAAP